MQVQPFLFFDGRCEAVIRFYEDAAGAELQTLLRHKDSPEPPPPSCVPAGSQVKSEARRLVDRFELSWMVTVAG